MIFRNVHVYQFVACKHVRYVDELRKRPFPIPDGADAALITSEPSDFSLEAQPKSYGRFSTQRPTVPGGKIG